MSERLIALKVLRHECRACGHCCHGHRIRLEDAEEIALVESQAKALGIDLPVVDGALRVVRGACVFLDQDQLCRIHKTFGATQKPRVCQQYPLRVGQTEDGYRVGIDPGCSNNWRSWRTGPEVPIVALVRPHDNRREEHGIETRLLELASEPGMSIALLLSSVTQAPARDELPAGFAGRLAARLKAMNLPRFLAAEAVGAGIRSSLGHLPALIATLDPDAPRAWRGVLDPESDAFAIELVARHLFLRVGDEPLPEVGQVIVLLCGAIACAWADARPEVFGPALSSWAKAMRHRAFWAALVPRPETLAWLATGATA